MNKRYRHIKSGKFYFEIGRGLLESNLTPVVIYKHENSEMLWVRPISEFDDGRFELLSDGEAMVREVELMFERDLRRSGANEATIRVLLNRIAFLEGREIDQQVTEDHAR
jgi:hypothetical protein